MIWSIVIILVSSLAVIYWVCDLLKKEEPLFYSEVCECGLWLKLYKDAPIHVVKPCIHKDFTEERWREFRAEQNEKRRKI